MTNNYLSPSAASQVRYNPSAFDGTVISDFLRLGTISEKDKTDLIDYSVNDFDSYKQAMISYMKAVYPNDYNNFVESDLGIMFVELFAYLASVLSLKADFLANEMFLPTVKTSENLRKLLSLIGIKMKGPVASRCDAKLVVSDSPVPAMDHIVIPKAQRSVSISSKRDGSQVTYTLFRLNTSTGKIEEAQSTAIEDLTLVSGTHYNSANSTFSGLVLLEGKYQALDGTFPLAEGAKTIAVGDPSIIEGSVFVSGTEGVYEEIESLALARDGTDKVFEKTYNDDFSMTLFFGDGIRGQDPPTGAAYKVFYRTGGGDRGDIKSGMISQAVNANVDGGAQVVNLTLSNSTLATGGQNAESFEHAKKYSPYFFKTQYRAVTGEDYTAICNRFADLNGVTGKALSVARQNGAAGNMVDIYLLQKASENQLQRAPLSFKQALISELDNFKMITDEITVVDGLIRTVDLVCTVYVDRAKVSMQEQIKSSIAQRISQFLSADNMDFGKPLVWGELNNYVMQTPDIRLFEVTNYERDIFINFNEIIQLNNFELNFEFV